MMSENIKIDREQQEKLTTDQRAYVDHFIQHISHIKFT